LSSDLGQKAGCPDSSRRAFRSVIFVDGFERIAEEAVVDYCPTVNMEKATYMSSMILDALS
jgi:hypothetical protein